MLLQCYELDILTNWTPKLVLSATSLSVISSGNGRVRCGPTADAVPAQTGARFSNTFVGLSNTKLGPGRQMTCLINPRHERFCQAIASGMTASAAYVAVGYSPNRGNASRLNANESIRARIAELLEAAANKASNEQAYDVHTLVACLREINDMALVRNKVTTALRCTVLIAKILGYWNNPARVQWELNGIRVPQTKQAPEPRPRNDRVAMAIQTFRKKH